MLCNLRKLLSHGAFFLEPYTPNSRCRRPALSASRDTGAGMGSYRVTKVLPPVPRAFSCQHTAVDIAEARVESVDASRTFSPLTSCSAADFAHQQRGEAGAQLMSLALAPGANISHTPKYRLSCGKPAAGTVSALHAQVLVACPTANLRSPRAYGPHAKMLLRHPRRERLHLLAASLRRRGAVTPCIPSTPMHHLGYCMSLRPASRPPADAAGFRKWHLFALSVQHVVSA